MKRVCIVIPVYKERPSDNDIISLTQCRKILGEFDIFFVCPEGLNTIEYNKLIPERRELLFEKKFFTDVKAYSSLCKKALFYKQFLEYEYILIYQTDCFVFRNELIFWCDKGYDFIGPPWINKDWMNGMAKNLRMPFLKDWFNLVGNGGFSLRRTRKFYVFAKIYFLLAWLTNFNEDIFWANFPRVFPPRFKIAAFNDALTFGFEEEPEMCYHKNNETLPFGCHAWEKHGYSFWKVKFREFGYEI
jgi:hypothetical protein